MTRVLKIIMVLIALSPLGVAFAPTQTRSMSVRLAAGNREEEIAKLEEQLRRLKEEGNTATETSTEELNGEINAVEKRLLEKVQGKDMILSEKALYDGNIVEDQSTEGSVVSNLLTAVAALVLLALFSQIPIGQEDLSKYSAQPASTSRTIDLGDLNTDAPRP